MADIELHLSQARGAGRAGRGGRPAAFSEQHGSGGSFPVHKHPSVFISSYRPIENHHLPQLASLADPGLRQRLRDPEPQPEAFPGGGHRLLVSRPLRRAGHGTPPPAFHGSRGKLPDRHARAHCSGAGRKDPSHQSFALPSTPSGRNVSVPTHAYHSLEPDLAKRACWLTVAVLPALAEAQHLTMHAECNALINEEVKDWEKKTNTH